MRRRYCCQQSVPSLGATRKGTMEQLAATLRSPRAPLAPPTTGRIAVIGCGYWGQNLVRVFHQLGALHTVCESHPAGREVARQTAPDVPVVSEFEAILRDPQIDGVVIATPAETHFRLGIQALEAGKHLYVEKPLALNYREGLTLVRQAQAQGR